MRAYAKIIALFTGAALLNFFSPFILSRVALAGGESAAIASALWTMTIILGFGWLCAEYAKGTIFPSFTLQLVISIVLHDALAPLSDKVTMIVVICTILAAVILKSGGDEVERIHFKTIALPTILISTLGYIITLFATLAVLLLLGIDGTTAVLLAAIIGSTDPAALIPTLHSVVFKDKYRRLTNISVAESAINDATGAIFAGAIIVMIQNGTDMSSISHVLHGMAEVENLIHFTLEIIFGVLAGLVGWAVMWMYEKHKSCNCETSYDFAIVLAVPIFAFLVAWFMGGNGFLAAFITGLMANYNHGNAKFEKTLAIMEAKIDSIAKPVIFMMAGPLISISDLWYTAGLGLVISLAFMFIVRPVAVFVSLIFTTMSTREKLFLCVVRETGVIPIVLAVGAVSQFPELLQLLPLVAWVVMWTLVILPAITPWWARTLQLTKTKEEIGSSAILNTMLQTSHASEKIG